MVTSINSQVCYTRKGSWPSFHLLLRIWSNIGHRKTVTIVVLFKVVLQDISESEFFFCLSSKVYITINIQVNELVDNC